MMIVPLMLPYSRESFARASRFFGSFVSSVHGVHCRSLPCSLCVHGAATIAFEATPYILKKGGVLLGAKILCGILAESSWAVLGEKPTLAWILRRGLSTLAGGRGHQRHQWRTLHGAHRQYGKPRDVGAYAVMSLESGPFLTMLTLGVAGLSAFPWPTLVGAILPLAVGMLLGNLDRDLRGFFGAAVPVLIHFRLALGRHWYQERLAKRSADCS
jgi:2-keto-3-deoxygluconate permease